MARKTNIYVEVEITKKNNPNITYKGIITWSVHNYFGFEMYSKKMEVYVKCELCSDDWIVKYF